jgi:chromosome segregation ATPase
MASEGTSTVPRMGSFKRALLGYCREEVDAAIGVRDVWIEDLGRNAAKVPDLEDELKSLSAMVIEREKEIRSLGERLRDANERHERSIDSLRSVATRLDEIQTQARGQATRIRMKALKEAVEVGRRAGDLAEASETDGADMQSEAAALFEGLVRMEIGPLEDFSQLVGFEDAIGRSGASEISVERFSEGRATLSMHLDEPIELLRELEERAPMEFRVRRASDDDLILDVDEDQGPEQRAA